MTLSDVILCGCLQDMKSCDITLTVMSPVSRKQHQSINKYYYPLGKWQEKEPLGDMNLAGLHNGHFLLQEFTKFLRLEQIRYTMHLNLRPT